MRDIAYRDLIHIFQKLDIDPECPAVAHESLSAIGWIHGGAEAMVGSVE